MVKNFKHYHSCLLLAQKETHCFLCWNFNLLEEKEEGGGVNKLGNINLSTLYNIGNTERTGWKFITAGATLSTIIIIVASYGLTFFFGNFGKYNELYGSIGSLLMILIWINVASYIMLVGFELSTRGNVNTK